MRDRLLHHALHRKLYPYFDKTFIRDSYSCRVDKGTHRAMNRFRQFAYEVSKNHTRTCWVLKCDIRKFFVSVDQQVLIQILRAYIIDEDILRLLEGVVESFRTASCKGLPLGNLTSQLLVNVYLNEFDQFVKRELKARHYIRYADDLVILSHDRKRLNAVLPYMVGFLREALKLELHPNKVSIRTFASGVDFLGWVHFPDHRVLRTVAKRRMFRKMWEKKGDVQTLQSYLGLLRHGNTHTLQEALSSYLKAER